MDVEAATKMATGLTYDELTGQLDNSVSDYLRSLPVFDSTVISDIGLRSGTDCTDCLGSALQNRKVSFLMYI